MIYVCYTVICCTYVQYSDLLTIDSCRKEDCLQEM